MNTLPSNKDERETTTPGGPHHSRNYILCPGCGQHSLLPVARDLIRANVWVLACSCGAVYEWESVA